MRRAALDAYRCPVDGSALTLSADAVVDGDFVQSGSLTSPAGRAYPIADGLPDFTYPAELGAMQRTREQYDHIAGEMYRNAMDWLFATFHADETEVRENMLERLRLRPDACVLETGCGTGSDTVLLEKRLPKGRLFAQDLSPGMLRRGIERSARTANGCVTEYAIGNAEYLSFPDNFFDAAFHFGGINEFAEKQRALNEMARVVRPGGRVVFGDESVGPWLRRVEYGKILINNNPLMTHEVPLELLPETAWDVAVSWILGNSFYVVEFTVGDGPPPANFNLPHKGRRGGTCNTRYYGQLEGVTPEAKKLAEEAAAAAGLSLHEWLDRLVREGARRR